MVYTAWEITKYRFRNDDGNETTATWMGAVNTPSRAPIGSPFRLRWEIQQTAAYGYNCSPGFQYSLNGGAWTQISLGSSIVKLATSTNTTIKAGCSATQQLSAGGFARGIVVSYVGGGVTGTVNQYYVTEIEATLQINGASLNGGDTLLIRLYTNSSYNGTPTVTWDVDARVIIPLDIGVDMSGVHGATGRSAPTFFSPISPAGVHANSAIGALAVSVPTNVQPTPTGVATASSLGTLGVATTTGAQASAVGVEAHAAVGSLGVTASQVSTVAITGAGASTAAGTTTATGTTCAVAALASVETAIAAGALTVTVRSDVTVNLGTVLGTSAHGTLNVSVGSTAVYATGTLAGASTAHGSALRSPPVTGVLSGTSTARATPDGSRVYAPAWGNSTVGAPAQVSFVARATARSQALVIGLAGHVTVAAGQILYGSSTAHATEGAHLVTGVAVAHGTSSVLVACQVIPAAEGDFEGASDAAADTQVAYAAEGIVFAGDRWDLQGNPQPSTTRAYAGSTWHAAAIATGTSRAKASAPSDITAAGTLAGSSSTFYRDVATYDDETLEGTCAAVATASVSMNVKALSVNRCCTVATISYDPVLIAGGFSGGSIASGLATVVWNERSPR